MKIFCVTDKNAYKTLANDCIASFKKNNLEIEKFNSVPISDLEKVAKENGTFLKYSDSKLSRGSDFEKRLCPIWRISNGLTHYLIYKWSVEHNVAVCILESDAIISGKLPEPIDDGIIQISSHKGNQLSAQSLFTSGRSRKFKNAEPEKYKEWESNYDYKCLDNQKGVIKHPLTGTIGTSGYIVGPQAAKKLVEYFSTDGIGFADRVREDHIGEGNLYLQVPQSVLVPRHGYYKE